MLELGDGGGLRSREDVCNMVFLELLFHRLNDF